MLVTHQERPRELKWYHAGPMLYGDWGTSRFYVLGLAFYYTLHASFWYVVGVGGLVAAVGWAYTIICKCYPDGGGVYSAAKHTSRQLAVIGALLLFADYIVTAAMSAFDGMHYLGLSDQWHFLGIDLIRVAAIGSIILIGLINYVGPRKAGTFALIVALATLFLTLIIVAFSIPHLSAGWHNITPLKQVPGNAAQKWDNLVKVVLALSGVEAIANMTGIMVPPVTRTSKKAIWPVLLEVVIFNIILAIAMNALVPQTGGHFSAPAAGLDDARQVYMDSHPDWQTSPAEKAQLDAMPAPSQMENDIKNKVMRVIAERNVGHVFGAICGFVFGLLLLSAVNTAVADMVSIQYVMSRDTELPRFFTKLNLFGVPWLALLPAVLLPILILCIFGTLEDLGDLYAIGVVGAIAINLGSCCINKTMPLKIFERLGMGLLAAVMGAIELTLAYEKHAALVFAAVVLGVGMSMRFATKTYPRLSMRGRAITLLSTATAFMVSGVWVGTYAAHLIHETRTSQSYGLALFMVGAGLIGLSFVCLYSLGQTLIKLRKVPAPAIVPAGTTAGDRGIEVTAIGTAPEQLDMDRPHVLVATRGAPKLLEFASQYAKDVNAILFVLFVRQINVSFVADSKAPSLEDDPGAREVFEMAAQYCRQANIPMIPIYVVSSDVAYSILDFAATYNAKALLMGVSRKASLLRALQGDTLTAVADQLPSDIPLLIHA